MIMPHFCLQCGTQLKQKTIENRTREYCPQCGWINYQQLKTSAGCRVEKEGKLLLIQRGIDPFKGTWHMPSGYIEVDELPSRAAARETFEESGLIVEATHLLDAYFYDDDPRGNGVVLLYAAMIKGGKLTISEETLSARFFAPEELKGIPLAGVCARTTINAWLAEKNLNG
jgi:ADP-ribose pyrophosphatase YjhB (NUDIX family)